MNLSENLKKIRKDNNLSQEDLAEKLGVSRQSVSKWESGAAYPEMDKMLQICKIFNVNIDELLNQNIKEVENNKKSSFNVNKYIDDFLGYVTKAINMFSSLKFKDKIKCLFEQAFIILVFIILAAIVGELFSSIVDGLFGFLPSRVYEIIYHILKSVYLLAAIFAGAAIVLHVFKTRYLDYYVIVDKTEEVEETTEDEKEDKKDKKELKRKEEKVIIRDPNHSGYKVISGIAKVILFFIKLFVGFIGLSFCASLVSFVVLFVLSFLFIKTGFLFLGGLLGLIGCITINVIILYLIYCFIANKKCKALLSFFLFIASLILGGVGIACLFIGIKDFKYINTYDEKYMATEIFEYDMNKNLIISDYYDLEYVESNNKNIKVEVKYTPACNIKSQIYNNELVFFYECDENMKTIDYYIDTLNNKVILDPDYRKITIYTTKENISILENNLDNYHKRIQEEYTNEEIREKELRIEELEKYIDRLEDKIDQYEDRLDNIE